MIRYVITDSGGQIVGDGWAGSEELAAQQVGAGESVFSLPATTGHVNNTQLELVAGVLTRKSGVDGPVSGEGQEVASIE